MQSTCNPLLAIVIALSAASIIGVSTSFADGIEPGLLKELRDATVLVKVERSNEASSGSGFLIRRDGDTGYVLTNQHVISSQANSKVTIVLYSGSATEQSIAGEVVASSKSADLALVKIESNEFPNPIRVGQKTVATETTSAFLFGFPFGEELGNARKHPAITISPATVSSLRKGESGDIDTVQLDGNLNPGNSGGPVLDQQGRLVGVAVATIRNAGIGFAIPVEKVRRFLNGDIRMVTLGAAQSKGEYDVGVELTDPFDQIRSIRGEYAIDGGKPTKFSCKRNSQMAEAKIRVSGAATKMLLTVVAELHDGTTISKAPLEIPIRDGRVGKARMVDASKKETIEFREKQADAKKPVSIDFGAKVVAISPSPDGTGAFVIREGNQGNELVFWDAETNQIGDRIQVPKAPKHVAVFNKTVLVTCPESEVVVVIDPTTKKVSNAAPVSGTGKPFQVCRTAGTDFAYILATQTGSEPEREAHVVEINLDTLESKEIRKGDIESASVQGRKLACQENFGGSPSGIPKVLDVGNAASKGGRRGFPHSSFGRFHPTSHGLFVATHKGEMIAFEPQDNLNKITWAQEGTLVASWADQSRFLMIKGEDLMNPKALPVIAVSESGSVLWKTDLPLPMPVSLFLTKNIFAYDRHKKLLVGTANHGSVFAVAQRIVGTALSQAYVIGTGQNDRLLFCISGYQAAVRSRFGIMIDEADRTWFSVPLPKSQASGDAKHAMADEPAKHLKVGERFTYVPKFGKPTGKFHLKNGPEGMTVDPTSGRIDWETAIGGLGIWDVEIVDKSDSRETPLLKFELNVKL